MPELPLSSTTVRGHRQGCLHGELYPRAEGGCALPSNWGRISRDSHVSCNRAGTDPSRVLLWVFLCPCYFSVCGSEVLGSTSVSPVPSWEREAELQGWRSDEEGTEFRISVVFVTGRKGFEDGEFCNSHQPRQCALFSGTGLHLEEPQVAVL